MSALQSMPSASSSELDRQRVAKTRRSISPLLSKFAWGSRLTEDERIAMLSIVTSLAIELHRSPTGAATLAGIARLRRVPSTRTNGGAHLLLFRVLGIPYSGGTAPRHSDFIQICIRERWSPERATQMLKDHGPSAILERYGRDRIRRLRALKRKSQR